MGVAYGPATRRSSDMRLETACMAGEKLADASIERLISSSRLVGLIGERQELVSGRSKPLVREPTDSSSGQAESCGDNRLSMGGKADRQKSETTRIISKARL